MKTGFLKRLLIIMLCACLLFPGAEINTVYAAGTTCVVRIFDNPGTKVLRTYIVEKGQTITFPSIKATSEKVLLGFSRSKNQHSAPTYYVGDKIKVTTNMNFYNVTFYVANESDVSKSALLDIDDVPYENVIFVGDSRTYYMFNRELTASKYPALHDHIYNISLGNSGLDYLKSTAYPQLIKLLKTLKKAKTAIIFNHGVNDLYNLNSYISFMKKIAPKLEAYNCSLFYMSVNPISSQNRNYWNKQHGNGNTTKTEAAVLTFNRTIKASLCTNGDYTYINTYPYLCRYGFSFYHGTTDKGYDDGLHYTLKTDKRIYQYVMRYLKNQS